MLVLLGAVYGIVSAVEQPEQQLTASHKA